MKSQKIKSQKLHVPILETNRKNLHPQKNQLYGTYRRDDERLIWYSKASPEIRF